MEISDFRNYSFGLVADPTPVQNCKFLAPLEVPKHLYRQSVSQSITYNRLYSILTRASRFEGEASPPQGPMRDMSRAQYFRSASHFGRLRAQYCRSASHFESLKIFPC